ncbi:TOTE conflict system archaeo-eukaryotic primase domain-containing protein [Paraburkholderia elongata]|uniref:TOTE conflict system archaeo-eukaryotic primase domain-containing protein n=1 Tax=Paraburkholderia elongata TaxID=2675747 RepID=UPI0038B28136
MQKQPRERGCSMFVDDDFQSYADQWACLASIQAPAAPLIDRSEFPAPPLTAWRASSVYFPLQPMRCCA